MPTTHRIMHIGPFLAGLLAILGARLAAAQEIVEYTDPASFAAATKNLTTDNFSTDTEGVTGSLFSVKTTNGARMTVSGSFGNIGLTSGAGAGPTGLYGTGQYLFANIATNNPNMDTFLPAGVNAVGVDYNYASGGQVEVVTAAGDAVYNLPQQSLFSLGYVGFTSTSPIQQLVFTQGHGQMDFDNFSLGAPAPGSVFSGQIAGLPSNITLSNAALLVSQPLAGGGDQISALPLGTLVAESGGTGGAPPPVLVPPTTLPTLPDGQTPAPGTQPSVNVMAEYTDSTTGHTGVALLVAEAGGGSSPPPVLSQSWDQVFNAGPTGTLSEPGVLQDLQNLNTGGSSVPNINQFINNNPNFMFQVADNNPLTGGAFYAYSNGAQIGTLTGNVVTFSTPEPATWTLAALGAATIWWMRRR